jgi:hypothetical protein
MRKRKTRLIHPRDSKPTESPFCEDLPPDPFIEEEPPSARPVTQVYNPRRMRWEKPDGAPIEEPAKKTKPAGYDRITFPFGEYKGCKLEEVPSNLLRWVYQKWEDRGTGLHAAIDWELNTREEG